MSVIYRDIPLMVMLIFVVPAITTAQKLTTDAYKVRVVTIAGNRLRGVLEDVTDDYLYLDTRQTGSRGASGYVPLIRIRKVVVRRKQQRTGQLTGAIIGGLLVGYVANQSLMKNPTRSPVLYGLTVAFAAGTGAAGGFALGSAVGSLTNRVVRPLDPNDPATSLRRQLEPFSLRYQQDLLDQLPESK